MVEMSLIHMFLLYRLLLGIVQKELLTAFWGISKEPLSNVWQNPSQYCKVISLQLKQTNKKS